MFIETSKILQPQLLWYSLDFGLCDLFLLKLKIPFNFKIWGGGCYKKDSYDVHSNHIKSEVSKVLWLMEN